MADFSSDIIDRIDPGIFRAYDIRGITTSNLTSEVVYWIGRSYANAAQQAGQDRAAVGRDARLSSPALEEALTQGLVEGGMDVICIGEVPTPLLYFATQQLDIGTGIMITGSHNPPEYNGLKMMIGGVTLAEERIQNLYQNLVSRAFSEGAGQVSEQNLNQNYCQQLKQTITAGRSLKVVVDCGNGVAGGIAPDLLADLGCDIVPLYCEVDGNFPNHHPDPADPDNMRELAQAVQDHQADLGVAFDGDGDRLGVITPKGEIIWPDKLMMLFAEDICSRVSDATIIFDVKCSRNLEKTISAAGGKPLMWRTGHSHIKAKIKETGSPLAGEFSGHLCIGERWFGFDDALYAAARLIELLSQSDADADTLFDRYPKTVTTPEIKIQTTETYKFQVMEQLRSALNFEGGRQTTIDGIRVDFAEGWGLIRPSNTSPVLSLRFEAETDSALAHIMKLFQDRLHAVDPDLSYR